MYEKLVLSPQVLTTVDIRYLELSLCRTFYVVPSAFSLTSLINLFGISNSATSNFHYVEQFFRSLQSFLGPSVHSNIRLRFSNELYCSFQAYECSLLHCQNFFLSFFNIVQATTCPQLHEN